MELKSPNNDECMMSSRSLKHKKRKADAEITSLVTPVTPPRKTKQDVVPSTRDRSSNQDSYTPRPAKRLAKTNNSLLVTGDGDTWIEMLVVSVIAYKNTLVW